MQPNLNQNQKNFVSDSSGEYKTTVKKDNNGLVKQVRSNNRFSNE